LSGWLATWGASTNPIEGSLNFVNRFDQTKFSFFNITAVSGYTNHFAVWVTNIANGGSPTYDIYEVSYTQELAIVDILAIVVVVVIVVILDLVALEFQDIAVT
jgi:hypothetical protein